MYTKTLYAGWADMDFTAHMRNTAYLDKSADVRMMFFAENGHTVRASVPVTTLETVSSVAIISTAQAFDDLVHHRPGASLTVASPQWLPSRLLDPQPGTDPVEDVGLVQIPDPHAPGRSVPAWVFGQAGQVLAAR